jgi:hypothetical protein
MELFLMSLFFVRCRSLPRKPVVEEHCSMRAKAHAIAQAAAYASAPTQTHDVILLC